MNYYEYALKQKEDNPEIEIFGGVEIGIIKSVENKLSIIFPDEYVKFLLECGSCGYPDSYISGLFQKWDNLSSTGSTLHDTLNAREIHNLPNDFIVLEYKVDENYYVMKVSDNERLKDSEVYSVDIDTNGNLTVYNKIFNSFGEYFIFILE